MYLIYFGLTLILYVGAGTGIVALTVSALRSCIHEASSTGCIFTTDLGEHTTNILMPFIPINAGYIDSIGHATAGAQHKPKRQILLVR